MIITGFLVLCGVTVCLCIIIGIRNQMVLNYRLDLLRQVSRAAKADINSHAYDNWRWRYDAINTVSYDSMVYQFWRPLKSFYKDRSFLELGATKP